MNENVLKSYEWTAKANGQIDLILSIIAKIHTSYVLEYHEGTEINGARRVVLTALQAARNDTELALISTHDESYREMIKGFGDAIGLVERNEFYEAGRVLIRLSAQQSVQSERARELLAD